MRKFLGCDSLAFLPVDGFLETAWYCTTCFTGEYPLDVKSQLAGSGSHSAV